jgi:MFS transporter, DHA2 family, multidrug resistance protein
MTSTTALSPARRWSVLAVVGTGLLLVLLDNSVLYTALPRLTADLGASPTEALWIINAYPVVMAGLLLGSGTLSDRVGHRRMFLIGLTVFGAASATAAFAPTPAVLIAGRALLAVGAAVMMPATLALIRVTFLDVRERTVAIAVWGSLAAVGAGLGPIVGGALLERFWWGSVFLVNVPVVVLALLATLVVAPPNAPDPTARWDTVSSVLAMAGLVGVVVAIKEAVAASAPTAAGALVLGGMSLALFARRQRRLPRPLIDLAVFRNAAFSAGVLAAAVAMFTIAGIQLVTTQRFQLFEGFSPLQAGLLVAVVAVASVPPSLLGAAVVHRTGLLPLVAGGLGLAAVGVAVVGSAVGSSLPLLVVGLAVTGAGVGTALSVASSAIVGNMPAHRAGMASSVEEVSYELGSLVAVALLGSLLTSVYAAVVRLPEARDLTSAVRGTPEVVAAAGSAFATAYGVTIGVTVGVLAVGAVVTGLLLRQHGPGGRPATLDH